MSSGGFAADVQAWVDETLARPDQVIRAIALEVLTRVVLRSPVGNPELWAANAHAVHARQTFNLFVERDNAVSTAENFQRAQDPVNFTKSGRLRNPTKLARKLSGRTLAKKFPLSSGKGYVGGRFRGNWQVTFDSPATGQIDNVDPSGNETIAAGATVLKGALAGVTIWLINNLPYSERLEYGYSHQAPAGMVRITAAEFQGLVDDVAAAGEAE